MYMYTQYMYDVQYMYPHACSLHATYIMYTVHGIVYSTLLLLFREGGIPGGGGGTLRWELNCRYMYIHVHVHLFAYCTNYKNYIVLFAVVFGRGTGLA